MYEENESMGWTVDNVMRYFGEHFESREEAWDTMCAVEKYYRDRGMWSVEGATMSRRMNSLRDYIKYVMVPSSYKPDEVVAHTRYRRKGYAETS